MKDFTHIDYESEKVQRIVAAALEVFSSNDYEKASTNMIVKKAGVPRGVLYYYFKNKEELYEYLIYQSQLIFRRETKKNINLQDSDYLNRVKSIIITKIKSTTYLPFMAEFAEKVSKDARIGNYIDHIVETKKLMAYYKEHNIDFELLKDDVDVDMFKKMAYYSIGGELNNMIKLKGITSLTAEYEVIVQLIDKQIEFLRYHFYK